MSSKKYFCFCSSNCRYETMTKEQILAAIEQAVSAGEIRDVDAGFITKVKETNGGKYVTFWVGTQAEYNALETIEVNCLYIITDDTTKDDLEKKCAEIEQLYEELKKDGTLDVSGEISLAIDTEKSSAAGVNGISFTEKVYRYAPALNIVFFSVKIELDGALGYGDVLTLAQSGGYGKATSSDAACQTSNAGLVVYYSGAGASTALTISAEYDDARTVEISINGWYFCSGK